MFAILALVIIIAFSFVYYVNSTTASSRSQTALVTDIVQPVKIKTIKHTIESKIKNLFLERFKEMSEKGWAVVDVSGAVTDNYCLSTTPAEQIACGITWPAGTGTIASPDSYTDEPFSSAPSYPYGYYSFVPRGLNKIDTSSSESISEDISGYMKTEIPTAITDLSNSKEKLGGYSLNTEGDPNIEIYFNDKDIFIEVNYNITLEDETVTAKFRKFNFVIDYNFTQVYKMLSNMIKKDTEELSYDLKAEGLKSKLSYTEETGYDIFTYKDNMFFIEGEPFKFRFLRENRAPDANTVYFTDVNGNIVNENNPVVNGTDLILHCPNKQTGDATINGVTITYTDPDEDDNDLIYAFTDSGVKSSYGNLYSGSTQSCGGESPPSVWLNSQSGEGDFPLDIEDCGDSEKEVTFTTTAAMVGDDLTVTITDPDGIKDNKTFEHPVVCDSSENCCKTDGTGWDVGKSCGTITYSQIVSCGPEEKSNTACQYGGTDGTYCEQTCIKKENKYGMVCNDVGGCDKSNTFVESIQDNTCECTPVTQNCDPAPSNPLTSTP